MDPLQLYQTIQSRRQFLSRTKMGLGAAVLGSLAAEHTAATENTLPHFAPKAKRVIFLFMAGAPSQLDLFDFKPDLVDKFRQPLPSDVRDGQRVTAMTKGRDHLVQPTMFRFSPQGRSGLFMSELLPHLSTVADDLCLINGAYGDIPNHQSGCAGF